MTDIAGLVVGVAAMWQTAVAVYGVVDSSRQYGMDYEIISAKFDVERVRLICWGDAVGLKDLAMSRGSISAPKTSNDVSNSKPDPRFKREEVRTAVTRLLGCIQNAFENTTRLQERYGLQPSSVTGAASVLGLEEAASTPPSQTQRILKGVFKRAYENLRKVARDRQHNTPITRKTVWAVRDHKKFVALVSELRDFNNSLASLFPDAQGRGSPRPCEATSTARSGCASWLSCRRRRLANMRRCLNEEIRWDGNQPEGGPQTEPKIFKRDKRLQAFESFIAERNKGALSTSIMGPFSGRAHVSCHVYWDGEKLDRTWGNPWAEEIKGFVGVSHAAFEMYKRKKYIRRRRQSEYESLDSEDYVLLDPESHAKFEHTNPGTVTVDGFGLECWDFEETKPREKTIFVNTSNLPATPAPKLLRRLNEIQKKEGGKFGWSPLKEELNLKELVGTLGNVYYNQNHAKDPGRWVGDLYSVLNRTDVFANFLAESSVVLVWANPPSGNPISIWNLLLQIILGWELAMRLQHLNSDESHTGFTSRVLATLVISDLWLKHVEVILTDQKIAEESLPKKPDAANQLEAEKLKERGNDAMKRREYQTAVDLYTEAMRIDLGNAVYRCNRSAALIETSHFEEAEEDAFIATELDPKYAKAWSRLGMAILKPGQVKRAKRAYEMALIVAGKDATPAMRKGYADAEAKIKEAVQACNSEPDEEKAHKLRSAFLDEDWDIMGKTPQLHSLVHEQQVEGLLHFAERIRWPYINEARDYTEDAYGLLLGGATISMHLHDWLYGLILPGKWFAFKIMTALILCTPSIRDKVGVARYYDCGLSLPTRSYWRVRTVLGRVLGCLPGVLSVCGWIGPCPRVDFEPSTQSQPAKPRHIRIKARRVAPFEHHSEANGNVVNLVGHRSRHSATRIQPDEELGPYIADMKDSAKWLIPEPPVRDISTCSLESIKLTALPLRTDMARKASFSASSISPDGNDAQALAEQLALEGEVEYRASLVFRRDDNSPASAEGITYKLYTNPIFCSLPPCHAGPRGASHEVHMCELRNYQNIWSIERLREHTVEADLDENGNKAPVMVINATGKGAEVLARAWCSERGRNAVVRRAGGPCFVCAVRAAGNAGLGTGTLIWAD